MLPTLFAFVNWLIWLCLTSCVTGESLLNRIEQQVVQVTNLLEFSVENGADSYHISYETEICTISQLHLHPFRIRTWGSYIMEMVYNSSDCASAPALVNMYSLSGNDEIVSRGLANAKDGAPIGSMLAQGATVRLVRSSSMDGESSRDLRGSGSNHSLRGVPARHHLPSDRLSLSAPSPHVSAHHLGAASAVLSSVSCPFSVEYTDSATQFYKTCDIYACPEDVISVSMCSSEAACVGDTHFILYRGTELIGEYDDGCGFCTSFDYSVVESTCSMYTLRMGCYGMSACSGNPDITVQPAPIMPTSEPTVAVTTFVPSMEPTRNCSFSASTTSSATRNFAECPVYACPGEHILISLCQQGSGCNGDTFYRLYLGSTEVAVNNDKCGLCSEIVYTVPLGGICAVFDKDVFRIRHARAGR